MIPISDDNPTMRTPVTTYLLLASIVGAWLLVQGGGFDPVVLAASVCHLGLVPGELTRLAEAGTAVPMGGGMICVVDPETMNPWAPLTSMFLHGSWAHLLGNALFLWVFGNNVEDSMGRIRFVLFYLVCGLAAAAAQVLVHPSLPMPMVGASGAISGVMGAYLVLYPRVRVNMLFFFFIVSMPAYVVLLWWFVLQFLSGIPQLTASGAEGAGVAFWAHVGGFLAGVALVKPFENRRLTRLRSNLRHRQHPTHP